MRVALQLDATGVPQTIGQINKLNHSIGGISGAVSNIKTDSLIQLAQTFGKNYQESQKFANSLNLTADEAAQAITRLRQLESVGTSSKNQFKILNQELGISHKQFGKLKQEIHKTQNALKLKINVNNFLQLAQALGTNYQEAQKFANSLNLTASEVNNVISRLKQLEQGGVNNARQVQILGREFGVTSQQIQSIRTQISAFQQQAQKSVEMKVRTDSLIQLSQTLKINYQESQKFANSLGISASKANQAVGRLKQLKSAGANQSKQFQILSKELGITAKQYEKLAAAAAKAEKRIDKTSDENNDNRKKQKGRGLGQIAFAFNNIVQAVQTFKQAVKPAYDLLIGQNERLNQELLKSQANIAANTRIFKDGLEVTDALEKVKATKDELKSALKEVEKDTLDLVGVTSGQVSQVFQILLGNTRELTNQSKEFPDAISAAVKQTKGWVATMSTLGLPLMQARQEINSVLKGTIDQNSVLAKSLGINNKDVKEWKSKGILVDELNKKFETYVAANKLAADTITGISSNIKDIFEIIAREAGEPLMEPITNSLRNLYEFLSNEQLTLPTEKVNELSQSFGLTNEQIEKSVQKLEELRNTGVGVDAQFEQLRDQVGLTREQFNQLNESVSSTTGQSQLQQFASDAIAKFMDLTDAVADSALEIYDTLKPSLEQLVQAGGKATNLLITGFKAIAKLIVFATKVIQPFLFLAAGFVNLFVSGLQDIQTFVALFTGGLNRSKQAVQAYENVVTQMGNEATKTQNKLKEALEARQNAEKNGLPITREQLAQEKLYRQLALEQIEVMKKQRQELLTANIFGKENKEVVKEQIVALEEQIAALEKQEEAFGHSNSTIKLQSKELKELGDAYSQLEDKIKSAKNALESGAGGDLNQAKKAANELIKLTEKQRQLGKISSEEAIANLEKVANNTSLGYEEQLKAEAAITAIKDKELKQRVAKVKDSISETEALIAGEKLSAIEGEKRLTEMKKKELELRLEAVKEALEREKALGRGDGDKAQELIAELRQLEAQMAKEIAASQDRLDAAAKRELDEQLQERTTAVETQIAKERQLAATGEIEKQESERRITEIRKKELDQRVKDFEKALKKEKKAGVSKERLAELTLEAEKAKAELAELIQEAAEQEYQFQKQDLQKELEQANQLILDAEVERQLALATARAKGEKRESELNNQRLEDIKKRIESELALEQERIKGLEALKAASPEQAEEQELAIREAKRKTAGLQAELLDNQIALEEAARAIIIEGIEREIDLKNQALADESARQELALNKLKSYGAETLIIEQERLKNTKDRLEKELVLEQAKAKKLAKLKFTSPEQAEANEKAIREAKRKTTELEAELINNQLAREENARNVIIEGFKKQVKEQIEANNLLNQSYQRQKSLLDSKSSLLKAQSQLAQTQSQIEIDQINRAIQIQKQLASGEIEDAKVVKALKQELASLGIKGKKDELTLIKQRQAEERRLFEEKQAQAANEIAQKEQTLILETEQNRLQQERLILQAEEAQLQAQLNQLKAKNALRLAIEEGDEKAIEIATGQLEIANKEIELSQRKLANAQAENAVQDKNLERKRQQLEIEKQTTQEREKADRKALINQQNLERAEAGGNPNLKVSNNRRNRNSTFNRKKREPITSLVDPALSGSGHPKLNVQVPKIEVHGGNFTDKNMVGELRGVRQDLKSLAGVMANRSSSSIINNHQYSSNSGQSDAGRLAIRSVNL